MDALRVWVLPYINEELICTVPDTYVKINRGNNIVLFETALGMCTHNLISMEDPVISDFLSKTWDRYMIQKETWEYLSVGIEHGYDRALSYISRSDPDDDIYLSNLLANIEIHEKHLEFYLKILDMISARDFRENIVSIAIARKYKKLSILRPSELVLRIAVDYYIGSDPDLYTFITACIRNHCINVSRTVRRLAELGDFDDVIIEMITGGTLSNRCVLEFYTAAIAIGRDSFAERVKPYLK